MPPTEPTSKKDLGIILKVLISETSSTQHPPCLLQSSVDVLSCSLHQSGADGRTRDGHALRDGGEGRRETLRCGTRKRTQLPAQRHHGVHNDLHKSTINHPSEQESRYKSGWRMRGRETAPVVLYQLLWRVLQPESPASVSPDRPLTVRGPVHTARGTARGQCRHNSHTSHDLSLSLTNLYEDSVARESRRWFVFNF